MFECCICLHIMVMVTCLIDSFVSCFVSLCLCALSPFFCCTCHFVLLCIVGSLVGSALSSVCIYVLKFFLLALNLVDISLVWYCCWFFAVSLFSCRCLVDLPGVKTLLLTIQQHQLLKGLDYHHRHLKTPMRIGSELRLPHTSTQTFLTSQLL